MTLTPDLPHPPAAVKGTRRERMRRGLPRAVLAVVCGVLLALSFPPYGAWPLSVVAVAGLSLLTHRRTVRQAAWTGFLFGLTFLLWLLFWLGPVGYDAWAALSVIEALFIAVMGLGLALVSRLRGWPLWSACLWVTQEWARDRVPLGGFPWGRLAFANTSSPYTPLAAVAGAPLVSFAVALSGTLLAAAALPLLVRWTRRRAEAAAAAESPAAEALAAEAPAVQAPPVGALAADAPSTSAPDAPAVPDAPPARPGGGAPTAGLRPALRRLPVRAGALVAGAVVLGAVGYAVPLPTAGTTSGGPATARVAIIQGNVPHAGMNFLGRPMQVLQNHVDATLKLADEVKAGKAAQPQLVLWPENSSDVDPYKVPEAYTAISEAASAIGVPILVGALIDGPDAQHVQNEGIVWSPLNGPGAHYTKQHPVPFGEYVPYRSVLSKYITRLQRVAHDFYPGKKTGILQVGPARIGDVICFEVAYDGIVRDSVTKGGRVLVVQTNNATYERTDQPYQQFAMSRLRAVEHGRAVLISSTSGISGVIAPDGKVVTSTKLATAAEFEATVPLRDPLTLADRIGDWPEWALALLGLAAAASVGLGSFRTRHRTPRLTAGQPTPSPTAPEVRTGAGTAADAAAADRPEPALVAAPAGAPHEQPSRTDGAAPEKKDEST